MPVIKRALGDRFQYTDTKLKKVLQTLHRHRRDAHTISMDPLKLKANKQRTGTNTRRKDVSTDLQLYINFVYIVSKNTYFYLFHYKRRKKGAKEGSVTW